MNFKTLKEISKQFAIETGTAENIVSLSWKPVPHADGYRVFSSEHNKNYFVGVLNTNANSAKIKNCKNGEIIDFKVKAFRIADGPDNFFVESKIVSVCPMQTPKKLTAALDQNSAVTLCWMDKSNCDGYKIYADTTGEDKYQFIQYTGKSMCRLDNLNLSGNVRFRVRSFKIINHIEKISNFSNIAEIEVPKINNTVNKAVKTVERINTLNVFKDRRYTVKNGMLNNDNHRCVIMLGGDVTTSYSVQRDAIIKGHGFDFTMSSLKSTLTSSDFSIAALDTDVNDNNLYTYENPYVLNSPSYFLDTLCSGGLDALALTGRMARKVPEAFMHYPISAITSGTGGLAEDSFRTVQINNIKVAFISTVIDNDIVPFIQAAKNQNADYIIVYCNWRERHTPVVKDSWRKYAAKLASNGVDFIVGCGTNTLCEYDIINTSDGRNVPVAYSLGCLISGESLTKFEDAGALICLRLKRDALTGKVSNDYTGYIPYAYNFGDTLRQAVILTDDNRSYFGKRDFLRIKSEIKSILGEKISYARQEKLQKNISFSLNGSAVISDLFDGYKNVNTDRSHLFISQLTLSENRIDVNEKYYRDSVIPHYRNLVKGYREYLESNTLDYLILDFYYTATVPHFELDGVLYSGGSAFRTSLFYEENKNRLKSVDITSENIWKPLMDKYIDTITSVYNKKQIILVRVTDPKLYYANGLFTRSKDGNLDKQLLRDMEDYFIRKVNPYVIALSDSYPGIVNKNGSCYAVNKDRRFIKNVSDVAVKISEGNLSASRFALKYDTKLWLSCVADYFYAIKKCSCDKFFFNESPADYIISRLSPDFISANFSDILSLKDSDVMSFDDIQNRYDFGGNKILKNVCNAIISLKKGKFENRDTEEIIRLDLWAKKELSQVLSEYFDKKGIVENCTLGLSNLKFYLTCACMLHNNNHQQAVALLVQEYYKKNKPVVIDAIGGVNLPAIISECNNAIKGVIVSDCSVLTAFENPVIADYSYIDSKTIFYKELARKHLCRLEERHGDWIIVDFNEIIRPLYKKESNVFAHVPGCDNSRIFKNFFADYKKVLPYKRGVVTKDSIRKTIAKFVEYLKAKYDNRIILSSFELNVNYLDLADVIHPFNDEFIDEKNKLIKFAEAEFIKQSDCYVINYSDKFISQQSGVHNRAFTAGYESAFYVQSANAVNQIVGGNNKKVYDNLDILSYIERAQRILDANPDMPYELQKQLFGGMTQLVVEHSYRAE